MPTERLKGSVASLSEELLKMSGLFRLEHDVQDNGDPPAMFTRTYRFMLDGQPTRHVVRFKYDRRTNSAGAYASRESLRSIQEALKGHTK